MKRGRKTLYFPAKMIVELQAEAERLDRTLSWVLQQSWRIARKRLMNAPVHSTRAA